MQLFKEKVRLEYLEEKGFLTQEEEVKLEKVRSQKNLKVEPKSF